MKVIEFSENSYEFVDLFIENGEVIYNKEVYSVDIIEQNDLKILESDFLESEDNKTFTKVYIITSNDLSQIKSSSFFIYGTINDNVYMEDINKPILQIDDFSVIENNFIKCFNDTSLISTIIYNLPSVNLNLFKTYNHDYSTYNKNIDFENKKYSIYANINILHFIILNKLFKKQNINNNEENSDIIIKYSDDDSYSINYENNKIILTIRRDFFLGGFDLYESMTRLKELINTHSIPEYVQKNESSYSEKPTEGCCGGGACGKSKEECDKSKEECDKSKEGCCGGGACGKSKEECDKSKESCCGDGSCSSKEEPQEPKLEKEPEHKCCKSKPDSECCKKNKEISCNCDAGSCKTKCKPNESDKSNNSNNSNNSNKDGFLLYIKGTKEEPKCKFSRATVEKLNSINLEYNTYNILENPELREHLKNTHPTFPQLWYKYKFICGGDTIKEQENLSEYLENLKL